MQLDLRLRKVFDEMLVKAAGFFQILASAVRTRIEPHVVMNGVLIGNRRLTKHTAVLAMRLLAAIGRFLRLFLRVRLGPIPLTSPFQLRLQLGVAHANVRVLILQLGYTS